MKNKLQFETVYRLRFVPVIVAGIALAVTSVLKFVFHTEVGKFFGWSVFLTFAGVVYFRGVIEQKKEREKKKELILNPPPPPTKEELQKQYEDEMEVGIKSQQDNIAIRTVHLFFGVLLTVLGVLMIVSNREYLFGSIGLVIGVLYTIYSIFLLRKWISLLKVYKEEKKKNVFDEETDH
jgi:Ca2+/Na+ antiporter